MTETVFDLGKNEKRDEKMEKTEGMKKVGEKEMKKKKQ
jgi:hypothetical protein